MPKKDVRNIAYVDLFVVKEIRLFTDGCAKLESTTFYLCLNLNFTLFKLKHRGLSKIRTTNQITIKESLEQLSVRKVDYP